MRYFLATDTCVGFLRGEYPGLCEWLKLNEPADILIPDIVVAELLAAAWLSSKRARNQQQVQRFLENFRSVPFDANCTQPYADIRAALAGKPHGLNSNDLIVAATVLANAGTLITARYQDYAAVKGLRQEQWTVVES